MNEKTWPYRLPLFLEDTQWAIAGKVPVSALEAARHEISDWIPLEGSKVVVGNDEFAALLFFGGSADDGDTLAMELSRDHKTPVYLLEFYDEAPFVKEFKGVREKWKRGLPSYFLASRGVIAPGYEPRPSPPIRTRMIGVLAGITPDQARKVLPKKKELFTANARGVLVNDISGMVTITVAVKLKCPCFILSFDQEDHTFSCVVSEPGRARDACFEVGRSSVNYDPIDSVLGETTLDGVLRVLDIPRNLLFPEAPPPGPEAGRGGRKP